MKKLSQTTKNKLLLLIIGLTFVVPFLDLLILHLLPSPREIFHFFYFLCLCFWCFRSPFKWLPTEHLPAGIILLFGLLFGEKLLDAFIIPGLLSNNEWIWLGTAFLGVMIHHFPTLETAQRPEEKDQQEKNVLENPPPNEIPRFTPRN